MPRDVFIGEGYEGDVMVTPVAPGQHVGHYDLMDGSSVLIQNSDMSGGEGLGRRPGPRRHRHHHGGGGWGNRGPGGWGPMYYEPLYVEDITARRPFILDEDSDEAKVKRLKMKLKLKKLEEQAKAKGISGLGATALPCIDRIIAAAAVGAREAIKGIETGSLNDLQDVCEHIRRRVCAEIRDHHATYAKAASSAVQTAFNEARPRAEKLLAARGGAKGVSGLSDWKGDIAAAVASGELDQLMSGVNKTQDSLISALNARGPVIESYRKARVLYDDARAKYGSPFIGGMPNVSVFPATEAMSASIEGVKFFARQVQTLFELEVVLSKVSEGLFSAGLPNEEGSVNAAITQIRRFTSETDTLMRSIPEYQQTKLKIIAAFNSELAARRIPAAKSDDPAWFEAYLVAADRVVSVPVEAGGMSGLGDLGFAPALVVLIKVIAIIAATVVAIHAINKITSALNSKAETARDLILQRERDWTKVESDMRSAGKSQSEINNARNAWESGTAKTIKDIPEPSGIFGAVPAMILGVLGIGVALKVGGVV
jgi:hypothetical protein